MYDVFHFTGARAIVCAHDDGQKRWTLASAGKEFWFDADKQRTIEQAIDRAPQASIIHGEGCTIRKRLV
jgi:hypothetical protein